MNSFLLICAFCATFIQTNGYDKYHGDSALGMYLCKNRIYLVENFDFAPNIVRYLESVLYLYGKTPEIFEVAPCDVAAKVKNVPEDIDLGTFAIRWIGEIQDLIDGRIVYMYAPSINEYSLYQVPYGMHDDGNCDDYFNPNELYLDGCIIRTQADYTDVETTTFNYTEKGAAKKIHNKNISDDAYCSFYVDKMKSNIHIYSPFHGSPIILIPGLISSRLFAQLKNSTQNALFGENASLLWLEPDENVVFHYFLSTPWADYLKLVLDSNGTSDIPQTLNVDVSDWGHPDSIKKFEAPRFMHLTKTLQSWGYIAGSSIRAAPYDFRRAPDEADDFLIMFKELIEQTYASNNNKRVVLFAHSMGNLFTLYFLNRQSQVWKNKFIRTFVCVAAPWYGSTKALKFLIRGEVGMFLAALAASSLRPVSKTWKSLLFLLPNENLYYPTFPIIRTPGKNYTVMDYEQLFKDVGIAEIIPAYRRVKDLIRAMEPPNVEVHCMYSQYSKVERNADHYYKFFTREDFPFGAMSISFENGDKSVNLESARACLKWKAQQSQAVHKKSFLNVEHSALLKNIDLYRYLKDILFDD